MKSSFFNAVNKDRKYSAEDWAEYFKQFITNGVFAQPDTAMQVVSAGGMTVSIKSGSCFINGYMGICYGENLTIDVGDSSYSRYDTIVARLDLNARDIHLAVIKGSSAVVPLKPSPVRSGLTYDLVLAYVQVKNGATSLTNAVITDTRGDNSVCGFVTGAVDSITTSELFAQYTAEWDLLKAACANDAEAVIAAWDSLNTVKTINGTEPVDGNIDITMDNIYDGNHKKYKIQMGFVEATDVAYGTITFDEPFTKVPCVFITGLTSDGVTTGANYYYRTAPTTDGFFWNAFTGTNQPFQWLAISEE